MTLVAADFLYLLSFYHTPRILHVECYVLPSFPGVSIINHLMKTVSVT